MANEPRRPSSATREQYTKDRAIAEDTAVEKKGKERGKAAQLIEEKEENTEGKEDKKAKETEEEVEELDYVRCICESYEEEDFRSMLPCDGCNVWQHNMCMGLPEDYGPLQYFCERCRPSEHKYLLEAIARGEKPWVEGLKKKKRGSRSRRNVIKEIYGSNIG